MRDTPFSVYYETRCLGSGCMMWAAERTHVETMDEKGFITGGRYERTGNGYCGFHDARGFGAIP